MASCFGSLKQVSKSLQALLNGVEAVMILTLIILKLGTLPTDHRKMDWVAVKELKLSCHNPATIAFTVYPYYGNFFPELPREAKCT